jgi:murein DD-endopeptidase MepM/ murein hydrolase activator NlpD
MSMRISASGVGSVSGNGVWALRAGGGGRRWLMSRRAWAGIMGAAVAAAAGGGFLAFHHGGPSPVNGPVHPQQAARRLPTAANSSAATGEAPLLMPVTGKVVAGFGWQYSGALNQWYYNPGITIAAPEGQGVYAAWGGTVKQAQTGTPAGGVVTVDDGNGFTTTYSHLGQVLVKAGQTVKQGQKLGTVGAASIYSRQSGSHLDFGVMHGNTPTDPMSYLHPSS